VFSFPDSIAPQGILGILWNGSGEQRRSNITLFAYIALRRFDLGQQEIGKPAIGPVVRFSSEVGPDGAVFAPARLPRLAGVRCGPAVSA
jgi:hypothetical protein